VLALRLVVWGFSVVDGGAASVAFAVARAPALSSAALCRKFRRVLFILSPEIPLMLADENVARLQGGRMNRPRSRCAKYDANWFS
jgi:hypothetical protein